MAKSSGEGKKAKKQGKGADGAPSITLASHPPAMAAIRRARATGGLAAFVLVGLLALRAGVPDADALVRALLAGVAGHLVTWLAAQAVWRHVVLSQVRAVEAARRERREQLLEQIRRHRGPERPDLG